MANEIKAVFKGDISPMEKAMAQLRAKMKADAEAMKRDLVIRPTVDANALKAAGASIQAELLKWKREAAKPIVIAPPARDYAASNAYLDQQFARISDPAMMARRNAGGMAGGGSNRAMNMGMMGQQVQDIAVQLQMGTNAMTVVAQQGSQLASIFGPSGMIAGAAIAVGGALYNVGVSANKAFGSMIQGAADSHRQIGRLLGSGGVSELSAAMEQMVKQEEAFAQHRRKAGSFGGAIVGGLGMWSGGDSKAEQESKIILAEGRAFWDRVAARQKMLEVSEKELRVAVLRSKGEDLAADAIEREFALKKKLAEIDETAWSPSTKEQMKKDATAIAVAEANTKTNADYKAAIERRKSEREALKQAQEANARKQQELDDSQLDSAGQLKRVQEEIAKLKSLNDGADQMADAQRQNEIIDLLGKELSLRAQIKREREDSANKAAADDRDQMQKDEAYWDDQLDGVLKQERQAAAKRSLVERAALTQLRSQGKNRLADKVEREMGIESRAKQIAQDTGLPMNQARDMAKTMTADEEKAARAAGRIQGGRSGGFEGLDARKFDALDAMKKKGKLGDEFRFPLLDEMAKRQAADAQANKGKAQIQAPTLEQLMQQMITIWQTQLTLAS